MNKRTNIHYGPNRDMRRHPKKYPYGMIAASMNKPQEPKKVSDEAGTGTEDSGNSPLHV